MTPTMHRSRGAGRLLTAWGLLILASGGVRAQVPPEEYRDAVKVLAEAGGDLGLHEFLGAFRTVVRMDDARAIKTAVAAFAKMAPVAIRQNSGRDFFWFHGQAASAFGVTRSPDAVEELERQRGKSRSWQVRLLLLDASGFCGEVNLLRGCLAALDDRSPIVVRRALYYLARAPRVEVVERIIARALEIEEKELRGSDRDQWERTLLVFQSTLHRLLKVNLATPADYRTYFEMRRDDPDLFHPERKEGEGATGLTLFGAAVTGKNICFILDTSGSMLTTDPAPPGSDDGRGRGRTGVGGVSEQPDALERMCERQRMFRAKRELARVVRALPSDVRFNLIHYDSSVRSWKDSMVVATDPNKKSAVEFIEGMEASGITVTDLAIEQAFSDLALDTIYLLTDGAPTHVGSSGPGKPPDADGLIRAILERVRELNFLRGVRIFTLGFKGAEEDFLQELSERNAGTYVAIE